MLTAQLHLLIPSDDLSICCSYIPSGEIVTLFQVIIRVTHFPNFTGKHYVKLMATCLCQKKGSLAIGYSILTCIMILAMLLGFLGRHCEES